MNDLIYSAYFDYNEKLRVEAIKVIKRTDNQVWVKGCKATGYKSRLDALHTHKQAIAVTPEEALQKRRALLLNERAVMAQRMAFLQLQIDQVENPPAVTEAV